LSDEVTKGRLVCNHVNMMQVEQLIVNPSIVAKSRKPKLKKKQPGFANTSINILLEVYYYLWSRPL